MASDMVTRFWPFTRISPLDGRSSAPSRYSSVLLPDPLGPTMNANRPRSIRQLIPRKASTQRMPLRYDFQTFTHFDHRVASMGAEPDGFHGNQPRGPPGRVEAPQSAHDDGKADAHAQERRIDSQVNSSG